MLTLEYQAQFKRDMRIILKRKWDIRHLQEVVEKLQNEQELPERCKDHALLGDWKGYRDCHIKDDWILIYKILDLSTNLDLSAMLCRERCLKDRVFRKPVFVAKTDRSELVDRSIQGNKCLKARENRIAQRSRFELMKSMGSIEVSLHVQHRHQN